MKNNINAAKNERLIAYTKWSIFSVLAYYISFLTEQIVGAMKAGAFKIGVGMLSGYFDTNMARWGIEWSEHARALVFAAIFAVVGLLVIVIAKKKGIDSKKTSPLLMILIVMSALEIFFGFVIRINWQGVAARFKTAVILYYLLPALLFALVIYCFIRVLIAQGAKAATQRKPKKAVSGFGGFMIIGMLRTFFISLSLLFEFLIIAFLCIPFELRRSATPRFIIDMLNRGTIGQCDGRMLLIILLGAIVGFTAFIQIFTKRASFKANVITLEIINIFYSLGLMTYIFAKYMSVKIDWINFVYIAVSALFIVYYSLSDRVENTYVRTKTMAAAAADKKEEPKQMVEPITPPEKADEQSAEPKENLNEDEIYKALFDACTVNDVSAAREIIEENKNWINVNKKINHGQTALWNSVFSDDRDELIRLLLENGADPNVRENTGTTPFTISFSSRYGGLDSIVKMMLEHGADVNAKDSNGLTALINYVSRGKEEMVKLLLDKGADKYMASDNGLDAISLAEREGNKNIIKLLK